MESEEHDVEIKADTVIVNTGWTAKAVYWNTLGTIVGGLSGLVALIVSGITLWITLAK